MEFFLGLIDRLPLIKDNYKSILFVLCTGFIASFLGYPIWLLYRNEQEIINMISSFSDSSPSRVLRFNKDQLRQIKEVTDHLVRDTEANRAIFGIIQDFNRIILVESKKPLEDDLPIGFQTVYLLTPDYKTLYDSLRVQECSSLNIEELGSYFSEELKVSNANLYIACPSKGDWFLAIYLEKENPQALYELQNSLRELELVLSEPVLPNPTRR